MRTPVSAPRSKTPSSSSVDEAPLAAERQEKVQTLVAIADLLERKLKPGRLAGVARRPADAYGGKTMLELIAADQHRELLELVRESFDWASAA